MELIVQGIFNGLVLGGVYMLLGSGLSLIFGTMRLANFAHGDLLMVAMYVVVVGVTGFGLPVYLSVVLSFPVLIALGLLVYGLAVRPVIARPPEALLLNMIGLSLILENVALIVFGPGLRSIDDPFELKAFVVSGVVVGYAQSIAAVASLATVAALVLLLQKSEIGRAIRAISEDRDAASAVGINVSRVNAFAFAIGTGCLGIAAPLVMPFLSVTPTVGLDLTLIGFLVIVMGGLGSFRGALIAALIVGLADGIGGVLFAGAYARAMLYGLFVVVLLFKPMGLYGVQRL
jgi:branched-chain amino acid transport system permease protein